MKIFERIRSLRPARWQRYPLAAGASGEPRTVLVTGATGFIGRHLCRHVVAAGDQLIILTRDRGRAVDLYGPHARVCTSVDEIDSGCRIDAIVNLAGEPIIARPWTQRRRSQLLDSRLRVTQSLVELVGRLERKPSLMVSASAVGYYGVRSDEVLTEADRGQTLFQSQLCQLWELTAQKVRDQGVRVCLLRFGIVLGNDGGALPQQMTAARHGITTIFGSGRQWVSWIHITDAVRLIEHCMNAGSLDGAINAVAPTPVRQKDFAAALVRPRARVLSLRVPAWLLRMLLGERSQLLVAGQRVRPLQAECSGFKFSFSELAHALADLSARRAPAEPVDILYDSLCPVCSAEMRGYCDLAVRTGRRWQFDDVAMRTELITRYRLDLATARKRVYVLDRHGQMLSGMDALNCVWSGLPRWQALARVLRLPLIRPTAAVLYDFIVAPLIWQWNARRRGALAQDAGLSEERTA